MPVTNGSNLIRKLLGSSHIATNTWAQILIKYLDSAMAERDPVLDKFMILIEQARATPTGFPEDLLRDTLVETDNEESIRMRFRLLFITHFLKTNSDYVQVATSSKMKEFTVTGCGGVIFEFVDLPPLPMKDNSSQNGLLTPMLTEIERKIIEKLKSQGGKNDSAEKRIAVIDLSRQAMAWIRPMAVWHEWVKSARIEIARFGYSGLVLCTSSLDSNEIQFDLNLFDYEEGVCQHTLIESSLSRGIE